jgi:hypothetical protein
LEQLSTRRAAGLAGAVFAVGILVAGFIVPLPPSPDEAPAEFLEYYIDNRPALLIQAALNALLFVPLAPFLVGFLAALREREGEGGVLAGTAFVAGIGSVAMFAIGSSIFAGTAYLADYGLDGSGARSGHLTAGAAFSFGYGGLVAFAAASGLIILRRSDLWRWAGALGLLVAVLSVLATVSFAEDGAFAPLGAMGFAAFISFAVYALAVSVMMIREPAASGP